jgi:hypothetical protein
MDNNLSYKLSLKDNFSKGIKGASSQVKGLDDQMTKLNRNLKKGFDDRFSDFLRETKKLDKKRALTNAL